MSQAEDMAAINDYMMAAKPVTTESVLLKENWTNWWNNLGFVEKNLDTKVYDDARNRRNAFNIANQKTPEAKKQVEKSLTQGISTEEMQGGEKPKGYVFTTEKDLKAKAPHVYQSVPVDGDNVKRSTIRRGSSGDDVKAWQQILGVTVDGKFGPATEAATKAWQSQHGLTADGVVGPKTWAMTGGGISEPVTPEQQEVKRVAQKAVKNVKARIEPVEDKEFVLPKSNVLQASMFNPLNWPLWALVGSFVVAGYSVLSMGSKYSQLPKKRNSRR